MMPQMVGSPSSRAPRMQRHAADRRGQRSPAMRGSRGAGRPRRAPVAGQALHARGTRCGAGRRAGPADGDRLSRATRAVEPRRLTQNLRDCPQACGAKCPGGCDTAEVPTVMILPTESNSPRVAALDLDLIRKYSIPGRATRPTPGDPFHRETRDARSRRRDRRRQPAGRGPAFALLPPALLRVALLVLRLQHRHHAPPRFRRRVSRRSRARAPDHDAADQPAATGLADPSRRRHADLFPARPAAPARRSPAPTLPELRARPRIRRGDRSAPDDARSRHRAARNRGQPDLARRAGHQSAGPARDPPDPAAIGQPGGRRLAARSGIRLDQRGSHLRAADPDRRHVRAHDRRRADARTRSALGFQLRPRAVDQARAADLRRSAAIAGPEEKLAMFAVAHEKLTAAGFIDIGLDHFARPTTRSPSPSARARCTGISRATARRPARRSTRSASRRFPRPSTPTGRTTRPSTHGAPRSTPAGCPPNAACG